MNAPSGSEKLVFVCPRRRDGPPASGTCGRYGAKASAKAARRAFSGSIMMSLKALPRLCGLRMLHAHARGAEIKRARGPVMRARPGWETPLSPSTPPGAGNLDRHYVLLFFPSFSGEWCGDGP